MQATIRSRFAGTAALSLSLELPLLSPRNRLANTVACDSGGSVYVGYELAGVERLTPTDLTVFVDNRESISHAFGLQAYANVMTHFAAGERYLNRCWSASTDGYVDEIHDYLSRARQQFGQALELLRSHTQS